MHGSYVKSNLMKFKYLRQIPSQILINFKKSLNRNCINTCNCLCTQVETNPPAFNINDFKNRLKNGPSLDNFLRKSIEKQSITKLDDEDHHPYLDKSVIHGQGRKVFFEVYGCQMNVNDTEIAWSILQNNGYKKTEDIRQADVVLIVTCSIREGAETKIWNRLQHLKGLKKSREKVEPHSPLKIGILGCMAERLKHKLIEKEKVIDIVAGPDSYRDLPRLLSCAEDGQTAVNVLLSFDETYADITPVQLNQNSCTAFVSIMRGCNNMCSYCIVPFTRGRERSRPVSSILEEIKYLSDQGIKEVTLLGQNVNSYCDTSSGDHHFLCSSSSPEPTHLSKGFKTIYKPKIGGLRFADLLYLVAQINPEMRIRFTSPHPKDFPDEVLYVIKEYQNVCKQIHLPAQSGSSKILERMRRGYTREAYIDLVNHIRSILPGISLSSDFICGFCGENDEDFEETISLIKEVQYNFAYLFPYSMREKTNAYRRLKDDVCTDKKIERLKKMVSVFREGAKQINQSQIGSRQVVLIEGKSKRSSDDFFGRNDGNTKVIIPNIEIPNESGSLSSLKVKDYVLVEIVDASSQVLKGKPLYHTTLQKSTISSH